MSITVKGLSKKYIISNERVRVKTLRDSFYNIFNTKVFNDFWALKEVNFSVKKGEVLGVIGLNGSGKSTLLKILSGITTPTSGSAVIKGRVASLLEVGTGFHPELTGRENIYLNGAILGMTKTEIDEKFDEIVKFAEVGKFIDTVTKKYSSGMVMRLAFSVAAHLDADILLIDEVLAVGDVSFQRKCLGRMNEISKEDGKTIIFVSHNLSAVQSFCDKCLLLEKGEVKKTGTPSEVIRIYTSFENNNKIVSLDNVSCQKNENLKLLSVELIDPFEESFTQLWNKDISLNIKYRAEDFLGDVEFAICISTIDGIPLFTVRSSDNNNIVVDKGEGEISVFIKHNLRDGKYVLSIGVSSGALVYYYNPFVSVMNIVVRANDGYVFKNYGLFRSEAKWQ